MAQSLFERLFKGSDFDTPEAADRYDIIEFFKGNTKYGSPFFAYIAVPAGEFEAYRRAVASGKPFDLTEYGEILASGTGHAPPDDVLRALKDHYGVSHDFEKDLAAAVEQRRESTS